MKELPNELINNIAQYSRTLDFISLRNTCSRFRSINYYPKRNIVIGEGYKLWFNFKTKLSVFLMLFITLLMLSTVLFIISIVLLTVDMGSKKELLIGQTITGIALLILSMITLILDIIFLVINIKITVTNKTRIVTV